MPAKQIPLSKILPAIDRKDRSFYDNLDDDEKKRFNPFQLVRYCANVQSAPDVEHYYVASTNHFVNKNMFDISKHPKLQWLTLTAASPGDGVKDHIWIKQKKKVKSASVTGIKKELAEYFPTMKEDDLELMAKITTKKELRQYAKDHGES